MSVDLSLSVRLTVRQDEPIMESVQRCTRIGEKPSQGIRRIMARYTEMLAGVTPPPADVVSHLYGIMYESNGLMYRVGYPGKEELLAAIKYAAIPEEIRGRIVVYVENAPHAEYCRLIEAVETM